MGVFLVVTRFRVANLTPEDFGFNWQPTRRCFWRKCAQKRQPFKNCALGAELRCRGFRFVQLLLRAWTAQIAWSWDVGLFRDVDLPYDVLRAIFHWS